jgi:hypothetical protein
VKLSVAPGRSEIEQSAADAASLPILIAVVLVAIVVRQLFPPGPEPAVLYVCAAAAVLDVVFWRWAVRRGRATFVVTAQDITFARAGGATQVLHRVPDSKLSFRLKSNGFIGGQSQFLLKLRDDATGQEVPAGSFGRSKVRRACESQGWTFS